MIWISMDETDLYGGGLSVIPTDLAMEEGLLID